jgi:hypothetical protein
VYLANYLGMLREAEFDLADGFRRIADGHGEEFDVFFLCYTLAGQCEDHAGKLGPFVGRYGEVSSEEVDRLGPRVFVGPRESGLGLLRDLHDLYIMASFCAITWTMIEQAAQGTRDEELLEVAKDCKVKTAIQIKWIETRMKQAAPQVLIVAS